MGRILISGLPRSGTTFLVSVLHKAGSDSGFHNHHIKQINKRNIGGLEFLRDVKHCKNMMINPLTVVKSLDMPKLVKHPTEWGNTKLHAFDAVEDLSRIIICTRNLDDAIKSQKIRRPRFHFEPAMREIQIINLRGVRKYSEDRGIPFTHLKFPNFLDEVYFLRKMSWYPNMQRLENAFRGYRNPKKVHHSK